jgi:hypothetical protein
MYSAHGHYDIFVKDKILFIEAYSPWNLEAAQEFDRIVREQVTTYLKGSSWAMIADLHGQGIYTPESLPLLKKLHIWRIDSGLRHIAIIQNEKKADGTGITKSQFNQVYKADIQQACIERYFKKLSEAEEWLKSEGY